MWSSKIEFSRGYLIGPCEIARASPSYLCFHNPAVVHVRDMIGVVENPRVVRDHDHGPVRPNGIVGK